MVHCSGIRERPTPIILSLSPEILGIIFSHVTYLSDIYSLLLVCRAFKPEAERLLYRSLTFPSDVDPAGLAGGFKRIIESPAIAQCLKVIHLFPPEQDHEWSSVPWPVLFRSVVNLKRLTIAHPRFADHLTADCPFRLSSLCLIDSPYQLEEALRLGPFFAAQTAILELLISRETLPSEFQFPQPLDPLHFLPNLSILACDDRLCRQLVDGRPVKYLQVYSLPVTFTSPPISMGPIQSLRIDDLLDLSLLGRIPEVYPGLRYLCCSADWPLEWQQLSEVTQMRQLRALGLIFANEEGIVYTPDADFGYDTAQCLPTMARALIECPSLRRVELLEPGQSDDEDDYGRALVLTRDQSEPFVEPFDRDAWLWV